jgi:hypothetical protein
MTTLAQLVAQPELRRYYRHALICKRCGTEHMVPRLAEAFQHWACCQCRRAHFWREGASRGSVPSGTAGTPESGEGTPPWPTPETLKPT